MSALDEHLAEHGFRPDQYEDYLLYACRQRYPEGMIVDEITEARAERFEAEDKDLPLEEALRELDG